MEAQASTLFFYGSELISAGGPIIAVRGVSRGATTVESNSAEAILQATQELLAAIVTANNVNPEDVASRRSSPPLPTSTPHFRLTRRGSLAGATCPSWTRWRSRSPIACHGPCRTLIHWNTERPIYDIRHIYLRDAVRLRPDLGSEFAPPEPAPQVEAPPTNGKQLFDVHHTVAFQGEPGAYSQEAVFQRFGPQVSTLACPTFEDVFRAVEDGRATLGLLPVENSQAGSINQAFDLLLDHDLRVVGEVKLRVRHSLMAAPGTQVADIRRVHSHYQALAQCERYLRTHGWEAVVAYDTAGAPPALAADPEPGAAAIASTPRGRDLRARSARHGHRGRTGQHHTLLPAGPGGAADREAQQDLHRVRHDAHTGALYHVLGELAEHRGINLTKLESRPRRNRPWHYVFYVDLEGHWQDATAINRALLGLLTRTAFLKLLGSYPAADE